MQKIVTCLLTSILMLVPAAALAHSGHSGTAGFLHGFFHPLSGCDHAVAMVAVGILAYQLGERALWLLPSVFVLAMGIGGILGAAGAHVPYVEGGIAISIVALGAAILFGIRGPVVISAALAGLFALFHGYAHGAEMPAAGSAATYAAGFMTAAALLHLAGISVGLALGRLGRGAGGTAFRAAGLLIAIMGVAGLALST